MAVSTMKITAHSGRHPRITGPPFYTIRFLILNIQSRVHNGRKGGTTPAGLTKQEVSMFLSLISRPTYRMLLGASMLPGANHIRAEVWFCGGFILSVEHDYNGCVHSRRNVTLAGVGKICHSRWNVNIMGGWGASQWSVSRRG